MDGIITSLVFDHALRIRMKAEMQKVPESTTIEDASAPTAGGSGSKPDTFIFSAPPVAASASAAAAAQSPSTTRTPGPVLVPQSDTPSTISRKGFKRKAKGSSLLGKINNLVTSDLSNISMGRSFLIICELGRRSLAHHSLNSSYSCIGSYAGDLQYVVLV